MTADTSTIAIARDLAAPMSVSESLPVHQDGGPAVSSTTGPCAPRLLPEHKAGRGGYPPQDARPPRPRGGRMPPGRRAPTAHMSPYLACGASAVHGVMRCGGRGAEIDS